MKTAELTGVALDWAVAKCEEGRTCYQDYRMVDDMLYAMFCDVWLSYPFSPSTNWALGGQIIEREGISVIKLEHDYGVDSKGYTTSKRIPVFGAATGEYFDTDQLRDSYGDSYGEIYYIGEELVTTGPTPLVAAMRCFVVSKLGDEVEVPDELQTPT